MRALPLILSICTLAFLVAPALAADVTIPVNKDYTTSDGIVVHFDRVVVSDNYHGNTYSPDPANTKWYDLYFSYENRGSKAQTGHLEVSFYDNQDKKYPSGKNITDITMELMQPGARSNKERFVEAAVIPKDTKIVGFQVFDGFRSIRFDISGGQTTTSTSTAGTSVPSKPSICLSVALLPLVIIGAFVFRKRK